MAVPFSNTKLRVPKGFQNILEGLAREVLRCQPDNVYEFGATYFDTLLRNRTETGHDPAIHGARLEDRTYNNHAFKKGGVDPSDPQQQEAAVQIQTQYRQHSAQKAVEEMREEDAAIKIQAGFRGYIDRQEVKKRKSDSGSAKDEEEVDIDLDDPAVEDAALKIQAQFKGFKARKEVQTKKAAAEQPVPEPQPEETKAAEKQELDIDLNDPEVSKAAVKIQSGFRGHLARQEIRQKKAQKDGVVSEQEPASTTADTQPAQSETIEEEEEEEEIDIDLTDPEVEKAAVKIQASFKGYKTRKSQEKQAEESSAGAGGSKTAAAADEAAPDSPFPSGAAEYEPKNKKEDAAPAAQQEEEVDIDLSDPEVEKAAIKIQAGFKGFKARKSLSANKGEGGEDAPKEGEETTASEEVMVDEGEGQTEEVDIDLTDPEVEKAALKIQAGYKGFKTRQDLKGQTEAESSTAGAEGETGESSVEKTEEGAASDDKAASSEQQTKDETTEEEKPVEGGSEEPKSGEEQVEDSQEKSEEQQGQGDAQAAAEGEGEHAEAEGAKPEGGSTKAEGEEAQQEGEDGRGEAGDAQKEGDDAQREGDSVQEEGGETGKEGEGQKVAESEGGD